MQAPSDKDLGLIVQLHGKREFSEALVRLQDLEKRHPESAVIQNLTGAVLAASDRTESADAPRHSPPLARSVEQYGRSTRRGAEARGGSSGLFESR